MQKIKCYICKKKLNLIQSQIGKCLCQNIFCTEHVFFSDHDCNFDFIKREKDILNKNNPIIKADKLIRI